MLTELRIKNYAVIEEISLRLEPGLVVLTGETGAGKSIIVGALSLVLGERASSEVIRAGEDRAVVEAVFDISRRPDFQSRCDELGIDATDGWLAIKRELNAAGRNRAWINGSPATAGLIAEFGEALVDLHGQHEHQALLRVGPQRRMLDEYGGTVELAEQLSEQAERLSEVRRQRREIEARRDKTRERLDYLRHQADEIESAKLGDREEDLELADEERRLGHAEELLERAGKLYDAIYGSEKAIHGRLGNLRRELGALAKVDPSAEAKFSELLDSAYYALQELAEQLASYRESVDLSPERLERARQRIDALYRLKAKYGPTLADVMETGRRAREELGALDLAQFELEEFARQEDELETRLQDLAVRLGRARARAARALADEVGALLPELGMPDGRFEVALRRREKISASGAEDVEFLVTLNRGFDPQPLARVASGGELSRVMLALKTILAKLDRTPTLVFDEIDAGIGGVVGQKIAERLRAVARHHQVFVITHLPQIAALADHHLLVRKESERRRTVTHVAELHDEERVKDLARMLGGDPEREASLEHARALLGPAARASGAS